MLDDDESWRHMAPQTGNNTGSLRAQTDALQHLQGNLTSSLRLEEQCHDVGLLT